MDEITNLRKFLKIDMKKKPNRIILALAFVFLFLFFARFK